jgi:signal transduction histidine kinase
MTETLQKIWTPVRNFVEKYPIVVAAVVIYLYYLTMSVDFFKHRAEKHSLLDYILEFDSLFFLWVAIAAILQMYTMRRAHKKDAEARRDMERALDRQQIRKQLVDDFTLLLQDHVNNPLAVISMSSQEMRRKYEGDIETSRNLERIESAVYRITSTMRDLQLYEAQKVIDTPQESLKDSQKK